MARLCDSGDAPPAVAENESDTGLTFNAAPGFTVKETGMETRDSVSGHRDGSTELSRQTAP